MISRFVEIAQTQGLPMAIYKAFKFGPIILASKVGRLFFDVNSKAYWNYRLLLNWSNAGGGQQTKGFAKSLFENVNFKQIDFASVLDFGCALGDSASVFREHDESLQIYLWDVSNIGLSKAIKRNHKSRVKKWDGDTKVDLVYCSNVIEHISDIESFVQQICDASKKWVCIQAPYREYHLDGSLITPQHPLGEHIWTIDDDFIERFLNLPVFEFTQTVVGKAAESWPNGEQLYFIGRHRKLPALVDR